MAFTPATLSLAHAAITAVGGLIDTAVRAITAAWAKAWDALAAAFTRDVAAVLASAQEWPSRRQIERDPALQGSLADAARALETLAALAAAEATGAARAAVGRAPADQATVIGSQLPPGHARIAGSAGQMGGFHQRAIAAVVARAEQRITALNRPLATDADRAMRRELVRGVRVGVNPRETASRMVRQVEGAFNGGLTRALTITRTETLDAYREAAAAAQDANRDVLHGWVWLARLDRRGCPACWGMHGTEHLLTEPGPQGHANCRCSRAPKALSWRDLGFDLDEPEDQIPDAETLFAALPRDQQLRIMGDARLTLLNRGAIKWADLASRRDNPGWRDSFVPTPLAGLRQAAGT